MVKKHIPNSWLSLPLFLLCVVMNFVHQTSHLWDFFTHLQDLSMQILQKVLTLRDSLSFLFLIFLWYNPHQFPFSGVCPLTILHHCCQEFWINSEVHVTLELFMIYFRSDLLMLNSKIMFSDWVKEIIGRKVLSRLKKSSLISCEFPKPFNLDLILKLCNTEYYIHISKWYAP